MQSADARGGTPILVGDECFWIPLVPVGRQTRWFCIVCNQPTGLRRPSHPGILILGLLAGGLLSLIGLMNWIFTRDTATFGPMVGIGVAMIAVSYWGIRSQGPKSYATWQKLIPPLAADTCPYCHRPTSLSGRQVRCETCHVEIVTTPLVSR